VKEKLKKIIRDVKDDSDIFYYRNKVEEYSIENENEKNIEKDFGFGVGLRVFKDKKVSLVWTKDKNDVLELRNRVEDNFFPNPGWFVISPQEEYPELNIYDRESLKNKDDFYFFKLEQVIKLLRKEKFIKKVLKTGFDIMDGYLNIINSFGMNIEARKTTFSFSVFLLGEKDGNVEVGGEGNLKVFFGDLDVEKIVLDAVKDTVKKFNSKAVQSGKYDIVLSPRTAISFLELISMWFKGDSLEKDLTPLKGKQGQKIFSRNLNIVNNGLLERGVGSLPFDAEGVEKKKKYLIKDGVFVDFLYDLRRSRIFYRSSDGVAKRSFDSHPYVSFDNFYIEEGKTKKEEVFEGDFILINDIMGLHLVDPVNLLFSLGARGICYKNGKEKHSVKSITISGNLFNFFNNIVKVGNKIEFYGSFGSPYLKVKDVWIAG